MRIFATIGRWIIGRWIIGLWIIGLWIIGPGPGPGPGPVGNGDFINFLKCSLLREGDQALFSGKSILRSELRIKGRTTTQLLKLVWSSYSKSGTGDMRWYKMALKWHISIGRCKSRDLFAKRFVLTSRAFYTPSLCNLDLN